MICFERIILIVLMIIVSCISFNRVMAPKNEDFKTCYYQLHNAFKLLKNKYFFKHVSSLKCVRRAIKFLSEKDELGSDLKDYYNMFPGQINGEKILDRKTFCAEINERILDRAAKRQPEYYFDKYYKPPKTQINRSMFWYKVQKAGRSKDKDEAIKECVEELDVYGPLAASNDEILKLALLKYRISKEEEKKKLLYAFCKESFKYEYLEHISDVVTLKDDTNLVTPWDFCSDRHPDEEQENVKPEDEASSSNPDDKL